MGAGTYLCVTNCSSMFSLLPDAEQALNYKYLFNERPDPKGSFLAWKILGKRRKLLGAQSVRTSFPHSNSIEAILCTYPRNAVVTQDFGFPHEDWSGLSLEKNGSISLYLANLRLYTNVHTYIIRLFHRSLHSWMSAEENQWPIQNTILSNW